MFETISYIINLHGFDLLESLKILISSVSEHAIKVSLYKRKIK